MRHRAVTRRGQRRGQAVRGQADLRRHRHHPHPGQDPHQHPDHHRQPARSLFASSPTAAGARAIYSIEWFDSSTERDLANLLDGETAITAWVRLHRGELPIVWASDGRQYNPDFLAHEGTDRAWLIETKSDKDMPTEVVQAKREAAKRWANIANASAQFGRTWGYLLISETNLRTAKGSWAALVRSSGG